MISDVMVRVEVVDMETMSKSSSSSVVFGATGVMIALLAVFGEVIAALTMRKVEAMVLAIVRCMWT